MNKSQKEFEVWAESKGYKLEKCKNQSYYRSASTSSAWQVWRASRDALVVELPCWSEYDSPRKYMDVVRQKLDELGISHTSR
jgi:hypothetical protein